MRLEWYVHNQSEIRADLYQRGHRIHPILQGKRAHRIALQIMQQLQIPVYEPVQPSCLGKRVVLYHADKLAAISVTQTFDDMIRAGLTYGCLTTGEAYVFLKVD